MSDGTEVRRGSVATVSNTETLLSAPVSPAVDLARSVPFISDQGGIDGTTTDLDSTSWTAFIDTTSTVRFDRGSAQPVTSNITWQVVQFFKPSAVTTWIYATSATSLAPPALDPWSHMVLMGSNDKKLHGVTDSSGTAPTGFTPYLTGGPIQSRPAVLPAGLSTTALSIAYVTSQDGYAYAVRTDTGAQVWKTATQLGDTLQGGPGVWIQGVQALTFSGNVTKDVVFVGTSNTAGSFLTSNKVYALNGNTGATVWTFTPGNMDIISSAPYVDYAHNAVWVTSRSNSNTQPSVWKINAANGAIVATWSLDQSSAALGDIDSTPVPNADSAYVYVGTNGGKLNAILASSTTNNANIRTHTPSSGTGAINGMPWPLSYVPVGVATPDTIIFTRKTTIHSVNFDGSNFTVTTPTPNWTTTLTGSPTVSAPVDDGANRLYIGASDGKVHQLDVATGADQKQATISSTGVDKGFNLRATSGYVVDGTNETYVAGDTYPTTRNGITFGWETSTQTTRDRVSGNDRRLAGVNQQTNNATQATFRVNLPAAGTYQIHLALGDAGSAQTDQYLQIKDNTTVLLTIDKRGAGTAIQGFYDATGALLTNTTWPTSEATTTQTFASTTLRVVIGTPTAVSNSSTLAHLRIVQLNTVGDPTFNADLNRIHVGATDGLIYTFAPPFP
jgi:outer membrane protein assembly factor BamB